MTFLQNNKSLLDEMLLFQTDKTFWIENQNLWKPVGPSRLKEITFSLTTAPTDRTGFDTP